MKKAGIIRLPASDRACSNSSAICAGGRRCSVIRDDWVTKEALPSSSSTNIPWSVVTANQPPSQQSPCCGRVNGSLFACSPLGMARLDVVSCRSHARSRVHLVPHLSVLLRCRAAVRLFGIIAHVQHHTAGADGGGEATGRE